MLPNFIKYIPHYLVYLTLLSALSPSQAAYEVERWYVPTPGTSWQWQLSGLVNTSYDVEVYDIDLFDSSPELIASLQAKGHKVICYFSAGSFEDWREDARAFQDSELGKPLDSQWEGEQWLDIRSDNVMKIMNQRLMLAASKGCDGVEPDNVDGYSNDSGFPLTAKDQLMFNRSLALTAHSFGLAVGLKNNVEQVEELVDVFDFAVNEQCFEYDECEALLPFIEAGKAVFHVEYDEALVTDSNKRHAMFEKARSLRFSSMVLPLELDDRFRFSGK